MADRLRREHDNAQRPIGIRSFENEDGRWAHTVGLIDDGMPELMVTGLDRDTGVAVLSADTVGQWFITLLTSKVGYDLFWKPVLDLNSKRLMLPTRGIGTRIAV